MKNLKMSLVMALVVCVLLSSLPSLVLASRMEIHGIGVQDAYLKYMDIDGFIDRSKIADFDPESIDYSVFGDFTNKWINSDNIGVSDHLDFTLPGFAFAEIVSVIFEVNFAGFYNAENPFFTRMGIYGENGNLFHLYDLLPDVNGEYQTQAIEISNLDTILGTSAIKELLCQEFVTFSLNFLKEGAEGPFVEGVVDNIRVVVWGNDTVDPVTPGSSPIPEPTTALLLGFGLLGLAGLARKKAK